MTQSLKIRKIILVEKSNRGLALELYQEVAGPVPAVGDAFQLLKSDDSGEYQEFFVRARIFREVPECNDAIFDVVCVVIQRPVQWQPQPTQ